MRDSTWTKTDKGLLTRRAQPGYASSFTITPRVSTCRHGFRARITLEDRGTVPDGPSPFDYVRTDSHVFDPIYVERAHAMERARKEAAQVLDTNSWPS
jgi:hypothetical protein